MSYYHCALPPLESQDRFLYLVGDHITKSLSPIFHLAIFRRLGLNYAQYIYDTPTDLPGYLPLLQNPKFLGSAVTMPFKIAIIPHLQYLTEEAKDNGAVNTIFLRPASDLPVEGLQSTREDGMILCGTNTDWMGIYRAFTTTTPVSSLLLLQERPAIIVGGGGTSRAAAYALKKWLKVKEIYVLNRDASEVKALVDHCTSLGFGEGMKHIDSIEEATQLAAPGLAVSCVPNFPPKSEAEIRTRKVLEILLGKGEVGEKGALLEMCYNPSPETEIKRLAEGSGWRVIGGVEAMIYQGLEQNSLWTGMPVEEMPIEEARAAINKATGAARNTLEQAQL